MYMGQLLFEKSTKVQKRRTKPKLFPKLFLRGGLVGLPVLLPIHEKPAVQVRQTKKREQQYITDGHDVQVLASASSSFVQQQQTVVVVVVVRRRRRRCSSCSRKTDIAVA